MIPNIFHFVFGLKRQKQPFHLMHYLCLESCLQVNQPEEIRLYYYYEPYGEYWDAVKDRIRLVRIERSKALTFFHYGLRNRHCWRYRYAHQSDFVRLDKLLEHGGIYADMDTLFVNRIPERLLSKSFVLGREADVRCPRTGELRGSLCNAFIMSEKRSMFGTIWRQRMEAAFDGSWSKHSTLLPHDLSLEYPDLIHVEPPETFYRHMCTPAGLDTLFKGLDTDNSRTVSMHLWSHLWWEASRRDFSDFHAGMLDEAYVREAETTYAVAARAFLPRRN